MIDLFILKIYFLWIYVITWATASYLNWTFSRETILSHVPGHSPGGVTHPRHLAQLHKWPVPSGGEWGGSYRRRGLSHYWGRGLIIFKLTWAQSAQVELLWSVFVRRRPPCVVCKLFYLNIFSSETAHWILTKLHRNDSWVVPYQSCSNCSSWLHK